MLHLMKRVSYFMALLFLASLLALSARPYSSSADDNQPDTLYDLKHDTPVSDPNGEFSPFTGDSVVSPVSDSGNYISGAHDNGRGGNTFVNDPCLDPAPPARQRTVQSETSIAVLNTQGSMGKKMIAGYNDSYGFYDNRQGLSGYAYSVNGGNTWIDGGGLPPLNATGQGPDRYYGDPVLVAHNPTQTFYYSSIYQAPDGHFTLSVNRGVFAATPPAGALPTATESRSDTRCLNHPELTGVPQAANTPERVYWYPPVQIVQASKLAPGDFLDKEWLYVDQASGTLYVTYTRFGGDGSTPLELARCKACAFKPTITSADWDGPYVIVPNLNDTFNQATMPVTTPTGRVVVTWFARTFANGGFGPESDQRIEYAYSDDDGMTFTPPIVVAHVNPQGEPLGYNRGRSSILNVPYIAADKGADDGVYDANKANRPGYGNVYITYFSGKSPVSAFPYSKAADIFVSTLSANATAVGAPVKVNDDSGTTSHVFPTVQVNKNGLVYNNWLDRRNDPSNILTDAWANVSKDNSATFGPDRLQTDIATNWYVRADARPNFGDYNSSALIGFNDFVIIWADGRFRPPGGQAATPDVIFTIANGLGVGNLSK